MLKKINSGEKSMVQDSQNTEVYELESQIRNQYGRLVFTYVTHNKMADILIIKHITNLGQCF